MFVIEPFQVDTTILAEAAEQLKLIDDKPLVKKALARKLSVSRTWTNAETGRQIDAEYVSMVAGNVKLKKADGTIVTISIEKNSAKRIKSGFGS